MIGSGEFRLLQVLPALDAGGVEQTTLDISRAVIAAGGVSLVASAGGRLVEELEAEGARHFTLPLAGKNPLVAAGAVLRIEALIRRERASLVHVRSRFPAFSAIPAARRAGVPVISTYHGVYSAGSGVKRWYNRIMTRTDLVIANSDFTRAHVLAEHKIDPDRVVSIPRGVDLSRFSPEAVSEARIAALRDTIGLSPSDPRPIVLLAGRLTRWKGQTVMIEALAELKAGGVEALLILAGDAQGRDAYVSELRALAARRGVSGAVLVPGHLTDMPAAYALADIAAAPSLQPEAFGRTAVEPQAMQRPVLAADHGAAAETVEAGRTGLKVPPGDASALAGGLLELIRMGAAGRARLGAEGRLRVRRLYALEVMQEKTLAAYRRVLLERGG